MKILYLLGTIYIALILQGCATSDLPPNPALKANPNDTLQPAKCHHKKDPAKVSFIPAGKSPTTPYQVIGQASVSQYSPVGVKRQETTIKNMMRKMAVALSGDAMIDVKHENQLVTATIIEYNKTLA